MTESFGLPDNIKEYVLLIGVFYILLIIHKN